MDCKFINENDICERYLLDRLNENEKAEYLSHLNSCDSCKSKLDSEKDLLASVRHFGKTEMKSEIAKQVAEIRSKEKDVSWDMILKVAAIFFFLVITPGLVYYYQSVEPPKIAELYDFDEIVNQQKEVEQVEAEEDIEARAAAIKKRKRETNEMTSELLKSASGAGAHPSSQSVGLTKPAKKSAQPVKDLANLAADDDIIVDKSFPAAPIPATQSTRTAKSSVHAERTKEEPLLDDVSSEMEQTTSESPQKIIPELEKFIKPKFFQTSGHEYFMQKDYEDKSHSNQRMLNPYKVITPQETNRTKKGIYRNPLKNNQIYRLDFNINNEKYLVNLVPLYELSEFYLQESYPDSFPVIKKIMYSDLKTFDFFVNEKIRNADPAEISIYFKENKLLYLNILDEAFYQIDLDSDSTKALIIH
jgi:hypothetical protein